MAAGLLRGSEGVEVVGKGPIALILHLVDTIECLPDMWTRNITPNCLLTRSELKMQQEQMDQVPVANRNLVRLAGYITGAIWHGTA
jgi:hypothetical protein